MVQWLTAICWLTAASVATAEVASPVQLLTAMQQAMTQLNYQGTVAILKNDKLDTSHYFHSNQNGVEQERLVALNSPLREVVRDNEKVSCLFKASQEIIIDHKPARQAFLLNLPNDPGNLLQFYDLTKNGEDQIALQTADQVEIKPKDQFRHTRKIWIAQDSKLPLKFEVLDFTGSTLEQVQFTDLRVVQDLKNVVLSDNAKSVHHIHQFEDLGLEKVPFQFKQLPAGFEKKSYTRTRLPSGKQSVDQLLLSDGLSSVSIYLEKKNQTAHPSLQTAGAVNSFSRVVNDHLITVIGDVPAVTVEFIAQSISMPETTK